MLKTSEITADRIFHNKYNKQILLNMMSSDAIMDEDAIIRMRNTISFSMMMHLIHGN